MYYFSVCGPSEVACATGDTCVNQQNICDESNDCPDGSDEENCKGKYTRVNYTSHMSD